jgi:hypothetical protein
VLNQIPDTLAYSLSNTSFINFAKRFVRKGTEERKKGKEIIEGRGRRGKTGKTGRRGRQGGEKRRNGDRRMGESRERLLLISEFVLGKKIPNLTAATIWY